ncbi:MAG: hypothetical protein LJE74_11430 [Proteobacteria bacterium]|jgi:hypothetical protein|nr:hypothetical protein [Pseudomonadota bacterium]MCG6935229.1 hypothetical protein [Pseudomonadota bacterium]
MRLKVKRHNPLKSRALIILGLVGLIVGGWSLFDYGRYQAGYSSLEADQERLALMVTIEDLQQDVSDLREEKARLQRAKQVEREASEVLDQRLKILQGEVLELKKELAFYRGIVSPRDASRGLRLQRFSIEPHSQRTYRYTVVLTQVLKNDRMAVGQVKLKIEGLMNGQPRTLNLDAISEKSVKELNYRFKYFQSLEGDLVLPKGFQPLRAMVQIQPGGRTNDMIEKTIDWPTEEQNNVG